MRIPNVNSQFWVRESIAHYLCKYCIKDLSVRLFSRMENVTYRKVTTALYNARYDCKHKFGACGSQ